MEEAGSLEGHWKRPPLLSFDPDSDPIVFQQVDIDSYPGDPIPGTAHLIFMVCNSES